MENTSSFLNNACKELAQESKASWQFAAIILLFISIPLPYAYSSIALALFFISSFQGIHKKRVSITSAVAIPVALFLLMAFSVLWSINYAVSAKAVGKSLPFLLVPLAFIFKPVTKEQVNKLLKYYSFAMACFALYYIIRAVIRYFDTFNPGVFFYHELVTKDVNAIHVSLYFSIAFFYYLTKLNKATFFGFLLLAISIALLSSKNIIIAVFLLSAVYFFFIARLGSRKRILISIAALAALAVTVIALPALRERFMIEIKTAFTENTVNTDISDKTGKVYNVSVREAWNNNRFEYNDYFPGTAFRVYQGRMFFELLGEDTAVYLGYGLNATQPKLQEKAIKYNVYPAYGTFNFHNQYLQFFAELGFLGFILLLLMLGFNIKNAIQSKDFVHIAFASLTITLFLTESFLSRQRGIVFFVLFYCLFNGATDIRARKNL